MDDIVLTPPAEAHAAQALEYLREHAAAGETALPGGGGLEMLADAPYADWLRRTRDMRAGRNLSPGHVAASMFFAVRPGDGRLVGALQIRHTLNDFLLRLGGHIGYGVRPGERRKGYATRMLALALDECRSLGLSRVLVTCNAANAGSARTIEKNGGVLENEIVDDEGRLRRRYWIACRRSAPADA